MKRRKPVNYIDAEADVSSDDSDDSNDLDE